MDERALRVAGVMTDVLAEAKLSGRVLVAGDTHGNVERACTEGGAEVASWRRHASRGRAARAWAPPGPCDAAVIRLPRARRALEMLVHAAAARVRAGGMIYVYGANDEGARSAARPLAAVCGDAHTVTTRRHCRVVAAPSPRDRAALRGEQLDWRETLSIDLPDGPRAWVSYPGVFARGRLDPATALLLSTLPSMEAPRAGARILDFGCGTGIIGRALLDGQPAARLTLVDADALAIEAARENVPEAEVRLGDGWAAAPGDFDGVVSNPPIHDGKTQDFSLAVHLVEGAAERLGPGGALLVVAQRTVPLPRWLRPGFSSVEAMAESRGFRVWRAVK